MSQPIRITKLVPTGEWAKDAIGGMVDRAAGHDLVDVRTGTTVTQFNGEAGDFTAELSNGDKLDAGKAGVNVDERGIIAVDKQMRTNVPHIFAIGDLAGGLMAGIKLNFGLNPNVY